MLAEISKQLVEMYTHNVSTKRSLYLVPFDKISESGDGGRGGGYLHNLSGISGIGLVLGCVD
jgi:hypothetical protein